MQASHEEDDIEHFLSSVYGAEEKLLLHSLYPTIQQRSEALDWGAVPPEAFTRLNLWRTRASDTLRRNPAKLATWDRANALIATLLADRQRPTFAFARQLHTALELQSSSVRTERLFSADEEYLRPDLLAAEIERLDAVLDGTGDPLFRAFVALVATVTIHPFSDGNGRVSRLLADAVLMSGGFLPVSFAFPVASHVGRTTRGVRRTVEEAIGTFLGAVELSYDIVSCGRLQGATCPTLGLPVGRSSVTG